MRSATIEKPRAPRLLSIPFPVRLVELHPLPAMTPFPVMSEGFRSRPLGSVPLSSAPSPPFPHLPRLPLFSGPTVSLLCFPSFLLGASALAASSAWNAPISSRLTPYSSFRSLLKYHLTASLSGDPWDPPALSLPCPLPLCFRLVSPTATRHSSYCMFLCCWTLCRARTCVAWERGLPYVLSSTVAQQNGQ